MTYNEFINKYHSKGIDYDGNYGFQCFDVINQWILDSTGQRPLMRLMKASDIYRRPQDIIPAGVEYTRHEWDTVALERGDIVVWDDAKWNGFYGHVALFDCYKNGGIQVFQQNGLNPTQGCHFQQFVTRPMGLIRLGGTPTPTPTPTPTQSISLGDIVRPTRAVSYDGVILAEFVTSRDYPVIEVFNDRAVLGNGLNTAFNLRDLTVVSKVAQPVIQPIISESTEVVTTHDYSQTTQATTQEPAKADKKEEQVSTQVSNQPKKELVPNNGLTSSIATVALSIGSILLTLGVISQDQAAALSDENTINIIGAVVTALGLWYNQMRYKQ